MVKLISITWFIIVIASNPNPCKSNPGLFKIIKDIHFKKIHENQDKVPNMSSPAYNKLISKPACKSTLDPYKPNFPSSKFLFKCPKCEVIPKNLCESNLYNILIN